jgi:hypothetical protein
VDWSIQVQRIQASVDRYRNVTMYCDSTGIGEPVYESLCRAGLCVRPYPFTMQSKAALIDNLAILLEERALTLPRPEVFPELVEELEAFEFSVTDSGNVRTSAPYGMHDDCVISLALAAWPLARYRGGPIVMVGWA